MSTAGEFNIYASSVETMKKQIRVIFQDVRGEISVELDDSHSPKTVQKIIKIYLLKLASIDGVMSYIQKRLKLQKNPKMLK